MRRCSIHTRVCYMCCICMQTFLLLYYFATASIGVTDVEAMQYLRMHAWVCYMCYMCMQTFLCENVCGV